MASVVLDWGWDRWAPVLGGGSLALHWVLEDMLGWGTVACRVAGCGGWCGRERKRQKRSQGGEGREEQREQREQWERTVQSALGPSAGQHVGKAETRSGRARAWRPSADSPDS